MDGDQIKRLPGGPLCPLCGKDRAEAYKPFCSARCADVDLHRWFGEVYRAPTAEKPGADSPGGNDDTGDEANLDK